MAWEPADRGNVGVLNDTDDFFRFFDATPHTEFLYRYVQQTIEYDLPREAAFLKRYDEFRRELNLMIDMPERQYDDVYDTSPLSERLLATRAGTFDQGR